MIKVLFVCMGNICRSPTAHGVFRNLIKEASLSSSIEVDSAGTHAYHIGNSPDKRSQIVAKKKGVDISDLTARQIKPSDFQYFDHIIAMDQNNFQDLMTDCPKVYKKKINLLSDFSKKNKMKDVPDPYYGGPKGFDDVYDQILESSIELLSMVALKEKGKE
tara:strand:- start:131 stop:613 length:483 start_codon:yes stop_codon:yes gene_type:complete